VPNSKDATKPAKSKPITIKPNSRFGLALSQYQKDTNLPPTEVLYRAFLYYWLAQKTSAGAHAVNTMERMIDDETAALLCDDTVEVFQPESELAQSLGALARKLVGVEP